MTNYVCTQLSNPNVLTGVQTCQQWAEYISPLETLAITEAQAVQIASGITLLFVLAFIYQRLFRIGA